MKAILNIILLICSVSDAPWTLVDGGQLNLRLKQYANDLTAIDATCECLTCQKYTRSYLHHIVADIPSAARLMSIHNIAHQVQYDLVHSRDSFILIFCFSHFYFYFI